MDVVKAKMIGASNENREGDIRGILLRNRNVSEDVEKGGFLVNNALFAV